MARKSAAKPSGAPWKLPVDSTRPSGSTTGLSTTDASSRAATVRGELQGVPGRAGHLRRAAHRVRVLHRVRQVVAVRVHDRRVLQQPVDVGGRRGLARVRPDRVQLGQERPVGAEHRLDRQRGGDVGHGEQVPRVVDRQQQHAEHAVGAVDQRQALLGGQRRSAAARPRCSASAAGHPGAVLAEHPALAEQHQRAVGQRGQVAGGAERAVLGHPRRDVGLSRSTSACATSGRTPEWPIASDRTRSSIIARTTSRGIGAPMPAACERISACCSSARRSGAIERVGQRAEAGRDAVDRPAGALDVVDDGAAGAPSPSTASAASSTRRVAAGDGDARRRR